MSRDAQEFPALRAFLEAYFHEDWRVDDPTPDKVVERFCRDEPMPAVQKVREEIDAILAEGSETRVEAVLRDVYVDPAWSGQTSADWLRFIASVMKDC